MYEEETTTDTNTEPDTTNNTTETSVSESSTAEPSESIDYTEQLEQIKILLEENPNEEVLTSIDTHLAGIAESLAATPEPVETVVHDYSPILEDIKALATNQQTISNDVFNLLHDVSFIMIAVIIGSFAVSALWKQGLKW